jgi:acetyl esterase/lipase
VTLGGQQLYLTMVSGTPGQQVLIIDNDGNDAISGTFAGLAEGAPVNLGGSVLNITYTGGDGNDVALTTASAVKSWTGAVSDLWSEPGNWSPAGIPSAGEDLLFPAGVTRTTMTNDLVAGRVVGAMEFRASYTLNGNALTLTGDLTFDPSASAVFICNADLNLGADVTFGAAITSTYTGAINPNGYTLTVHPYNTLITGALNGNGVVDLNGGVTMTGGGTFSGTILGTLELSGSMPNATIDGGGLSGSGEVGAVTLTGAPLYLGAKPPCCADSHTAGTLHTKSISIGGSMYVDVIGGGASDALQVTGAVTLDDASLFLTVPSGSPDAGQTFTIIENDGNDAVDGTFTDLPEATLIPRSPWAFRISYVGGDGNDVVLTEIDPTVTSPSQDNATTRIGESATFSATVTSRVHVPTGTVTFTDNGAFIKSAPLVSGTASIAYAPTEPGTHTIGAAYDGTPIFAPSTSSMTHQVLRGQSATTMNVAASSMIYGEAKTLAVNVAPVAPATGVPSGSVTLKANGTSVGAAALHQGAASLTAGLLDAGTYTIAATYVGDTRFESSDSTGSSLTVAKAPTIIDATADGGLTIAVRAPHRLDLPVGGAVTVSEGGALLTQQSLTGGVAEIALLLSPGDHPLTIAYLGNGNFEVSNASIVHTVAQPRLSVADAIVTEGDFGEKALIVPVELSSLTTDTVTVAYAIEDGTAKDGEDYRKVTGTLVFQPGVAVREIEIPIYGDTNSEADETLTVTLSAASNATLDRSSAIITINNDELSYRLTAGVQFAAHNLTLDVYTPLDGAGPFPLILWIPGTTSYDAASVLPIALRETGRGYSVAFVRYRAAGAAPFPAQLEDLQQAVRFLRSSGGRFNLDPYRFAVWGSSAGAHLASLLGTTNDGISVSTTPTLTSRVQAVVAWGGTSDLLHLQNDGAASSCGTNFNSVTSPQSLLIGCAIQTCSDKALAASPISLASDDDPPFLIMHGTNDCVVPAGQSTRLYDALRAAGVSAKLRTVNAGAPATWTSPELLKEVETFLDAQLKGNSKRRAAGH